MTAVTVAIIVLLVTGHVIITSWGHSDSDNMMASPSLL